MDGQYGLTEEIAKAHQRHLLAEAARERTARKVMFATTRRWRLVLRADVGGMIEELFARKRDVATLQGVADGLTVSAS